MAKKLLILNCRYEDGHDERFGLRDELSTVSGGWLHFNLFDGGSLAVRDDPRLQWWTIMEDVSG